MECKNCGGNLQDDGGFCSYCGARFIDERISTKFLMKEILDKVLSVDNKLLKTFWHLFSKPEEVINGYINGVRKRYYNPFSYILISITLAGISFYFLKDFALESINATTSTSSSTNPFENKEFAEDFVSLIFDYQAFLTAAILPIYAFISWIVFLNKRKYNYLEHIVIYIYSTAQFSILNFFIATPVFFIDNQAGNIASLALSVLSFVYIAYVLIRLFKLSFFQFIIKTLYFLVVGLTLYIVSSILVGIGMFLFLGPEYFKQFKPKAPTQDSIQKVQPLDSLKNLKLNDSIKKVKSLDTIKKDPKALSFYEASSKLNCLS